MSWKQKNKGDPMVLTHKKVAEQKKIKIIVKPEDHERKFMSREDAVKKNQKMKEDQLKIDAYAEKLKNETIVENSSVNDNSKGLVDEVPAGNLSGGGEDTVESKRGRGR